MITYIILRIILPLNVRVHWTLQYLSICRAVSQEGAMCAEFKSTLFTFSINITHLSKQIV